jgi:hypothetical protein
MPAVRSSIRGEVVRKELPAPTGAFCEFAIAFDNNLSPEMGTSARLTLDSPLTLEALGSTMRCGTARAG